MLRLKLTLALALAVLFAPSAFAQSGPSVLVYLGTGANNESETLELDDAPFVVGVTMLAGNAPLSLGFDLAGEGEMLDSTYGTNAIRQALSFNLLLGTNLYNSIGFRADASLILGMRETFSDCPDSFIGYQCYADEPPETDYDFNYGGMLNLTFDRFSVGVRATEVSTQAVVGIAF